MTAGRFRAMLRRGPLLLVLLLMAGTAAGLDTYYLSPSAVVLAEFLEPPPVPGSPEDQADLDAVLRIQAERTPAAVADAKADALVSVFRFADVLGPAFSSERLPLTDGFFKAVGRDATQIGLRAKVYWKRPRPGFASDKVAAVLAVSNEGAYPSGHAMYGCLTAALLGVMVPEQRTALLERGQRYAWNRVVAGVHYPTDVHAGCTGGKIVAAVLLQSPRFQDDLAAAREETRRALGLTPAAPAPGN
jgi:acid phosphatase (class A)